jgi:phage terminase large subunit GpA-like protein
MDAMGDPAIPLVVLMTSSQVGKALALDTPIATPSGWTAMGDLAVGDELFDQLGRRCRVTFATPVMHDRECYRVIFSDDSSIVADADHLWAVQSDTVLVRGTPWGGRGPREGVLTTREIAATCNWITGKRRIVRNRYAIPVTRPLDLPDTVLPIDPYTLGVWLGDGHSYSGNFTAEEQDLPHIADELATTLTMAIRLSDDKAIPAAYLRASKAQRLALLQGLMDTDGSCHSNGRCEIITTSPLLAAGYSELLASLGIKFTAKTADGERRPGAEATRFSFLAYAETPVFRMPRKVMPQVSRHGSRRTTETERRRIVVVEPVPSVPVRCIQVDSLSHLFLAGRAMIPTHNTEMTLNLCGFHMDRDPAPILVIQPTLDMAKAWSKDRLAPMLRDSPTFRGLIADPRTRDSGNTLLHKEYEGGQITMAGANSPASLASRPIRVLVCDEVDRYPASAGDEGDPLALAQKRTTTFWNRKTVLTSTPTIKGLSRIERAWETTDQRFYEVPCPQCGAFQKLEWGGKTSAYGIRWSQDENGQHLPDTVVYICRHNGCVIEEKSKPEMIREGRWVATRPFNGIAGFHIWAGYSLHVNSAWPTLVREWLAAKGDPFTRQAFINLALGQSYEDRGERDIGELGLLRRCEVWAGEVPGQVAVITVGADVQDDRIELEVVGWGRNEESWSIAHEVIEGEPESPQVWTQVDAFLKRRWRRADGREFEVLAACIDSGGHHTQRVYEFCRARLARRIWAIKGEAAQGGKRSPVWPTKRPTSRTKATFRPVIVGVNAAKDVIRARLHIPEPGPGYTHFPADRDINYFAQLVAERSIVKQTAGHQYRVWELPPGRANEALDCRVYAYAALCGLLHFGLKLNRRADEVQASGPVVPGVVAHIAAPPAAVTEAQHPRRSRLSRMIGG